MRMKPGVSDDRHTPIARQRPAWTTRPGGRRSRSSLVLGVLVLAAVVSTRWVRLNLSPSVPLGVYRLAPLSPPPSARHPGRPVAACEHPPMVALVGLVTGLPLQSKALEVSEVAVFTEEYVQTAVFS